MKRIRNNNAWNYSLIECFYLTTKFQYCFLSIFSNNFTVKHILINTDVFNSCAKLFTSFNNEIPVEVLSIVSRDNIRFKVLNHTQKHFNVMQLTYIFFLFSIACYSKDSFKIYFISFIHYRAVKPNTKLIDSTISWIESLRLQVEYHSDDIIIIIIPLKETLSCRNHKLFLWSYNKILSTVFFCRRFIIVITIF